MKIQNLLQKLTVEQKAVLVSGVNFWSTTAVAELGIPSLVMADGPHGVRKQALGEDHLGINQSLPATAFPTASAMASSWNLDLAEKLGSALAKEARHFGVGILLGPGVNIKRSPLCGRNFEYMSEDPLLSGLMGAAWVSGLQAQGVGASVKHYVANDQETNRMSISAQIDERTFREIYLKAFELVIRNAKPASVMASYNSVNGEPVATSRHLLTSVLREEWGFEGFVVSDWGAASQDLIEAIKAGLDLDMPGAGSGVKRIMHALELGHLTVEQLDVAVNRLLKAIDTYSNVEGPEPDWGTHHEIAREIALESAVLLKNENVLPLSLEDHKGSNKLLVVGSLATEPRYQGAGSSHVVPNRLEVPLDEIKKIAGGEVEVVYEQGYDLSGEDDNALRAAAKRAASEAKTVLIYAGLPEGDESESLDRTSIELPENQADLIREICKINDRVVVVLANGGVVADSNWMTYTASILEMWLGGQAMASAAAQLIFGLETPSGKLSETIPLQLSDTPSFHNFPGDGKTVIYGERIYVGYRHYSSANRKVQYPFGFGLSYTRFEYSDFTVSLNGDSMLLAVDVTNIGSTSGSETVQFYSQAPQSAFDRPFIELVGFKKVRIEPGQTERVQVVVPIANFDYWHPTAQKWAHSGGSYTIHAAASSEDFRQSLEVHLNSTEPKVSLTLDSALGDWLDDPIGNIAMTEMLSRYSTKDVPGWDEETLLLVRPIPVRTILPMAASKLPFAELGPLLLTRLHEVSSEKEN